MNRKAAVIGKCISIISKINISYWIYHNTWYVYSGAKRHNNEHFYLIHFYVEKSTEEVVSTVAIKYWPDAIISFLKNLIEWTVPIPNANGGVSTETTDDMNEEPQQISCEYSFCSFLFATSMSIKNLQQIVAIAQTGANKPIFYCFLVYIKMSHQAIHENWAEKKKDFFWLRIRMCQCGKTFLLPFCVIFMYDLVWYCDLHKK